MSIYIFNFLLFALLSFKFLKFNKNIINFGLFLLILYLAWFIGFRYEVGGDWYAYLFHYEHLTYDDILLQMLSWDPAYVAVEYFSKYLGFGIWGVNTICALIFLLSFVYFIKAFRLKIGYSFLIAYPYLIMVVVNGYSRQGVAIGLSLVFYALLYKKKVLKAIIALLFASLFHKTAIIVGILLLFHGKKSSINSLVYSLLFISISYGMYTLFQSHFEFFMKYYFEKQMQSSGGIIRILINISAAILLFIFTGRYKKHFDDYNFWKVFGYISFFMLFVAIYFKTTTVADRLLLYFYPLQIVIFQRILFLIKDKHLKMLYFYGLFLFYLSILILWLNFATHRFAWIPYDNYIFRWLE